MDLYLVAIIAIALSFDFINGLHDAANSIATVVSTRVLSPRAAVVWAAAFNFIAFLVYPSHVSASIAKGVALSAISYNVILATLLGAKIFGKTLAFIVIAPMLGMVIALGLMTLIRRVFGHMRPGRIDKVFRRGQLVSAAFYSLGHGGNDAQKTMGIITLLLISAGLQQGSTHPAPQLWVVLSCHTLSGGWRIVKTMGMKITKLKPPGGFCAETSGAITLALATFLGVPVSTTHTITGAIVGVGTALRRMSAVRWGVAGRIVWAWIFTIPAAALIAVGAYYIIRAISQTS